MDHLIPCPNNIAGGELVNTFQIYCPPDLQIVEAHAGVRDNIKFPCVWVITYSVRNAEPGAIAPFRSSNIRKVIYKEVSMVKPRNTDIINHYPVKTDNGQFWVFEYGIHCYCKPDQVFPSDVDRTHTLRELLNL